MRPRTTFAFPACIARLCLVGGLCLAGGLPAQAPGPDDGAFDFLHGTWSLVKDGLSLTVEFTPILDARAWQETQIVDDGNHTASTAIFAFDPEKGLWRRTWFGPRGLRSTFVGRSREDGAVVLEQVSFEGRDFESPPSRLVYSPVEKGRFVLDWQTRREDGSWAPRPKPFLHERVSRPEPPPSPGRIAFISKRTGDWEIFSMAPDGSDLRNVTNHPAGDHFPRWIAGGARLAFRSQRSRSDGAWDRWEIDADGSDARHVPILERLGNPDVGEFPEVHPSGSYLINAVEREGELNLYVWRFDGGGERVLAPAPGPDYRPLFSPDGSRVLFISERDGNAEIYSVEFDGSDLRRLTSSAGIDRYARWSPDGSRIAFASDRDGDLELFVMRADGSELRQLTRNEVEDGEVAWSPDGRYLVYRSDAFGDSEVCVLELATGAITNLSRDPAYDAEPVWIAAPRASGGPTP